MATPPSPLQEIPHIVTASASDFNTAPTSIAPQESETKTVVMGSLPQAEAKPGNPARLPIKKPPNPLQYLDASGNEDTEASNTGQASPVIEDAEAGRSVALQISEATHFLITSLDYVSKRLQTAEDKLTSLETRVAESPSVIDRNKRSSDTAFCVPYLRNREFVGRKDDFGRMFSMWKRGQKGRIAVTGLGGIGKTEFLLEFVYRIKDLTPKTPIFWFRPEDLGSAKARDTVSDVHVYQLDEWIKADYSPECILVVDSGDNFDDMVEVTSEQEQLIENLRDFAGTVIILARSTYNIRDLVNYHNIFELPDLDVAPAARILHGRLGAFARDNSPYKDIEGIASLLTCSPRALIQVSRIINRSGMKLCQFIEIYQKDDDSKLRLLSNIDPIVTAPRHDLSIFGRGVVDLPSFRKEFPGTPSKMLYQLYYLGGKSIPRSIFASIDVLEMIITLLILKGNFLLVEDERSHAFSLHPLVYLTLHKQFSDAHLLADDLTVLEQRRWREETILLFSKSYLYHNSESKDKTWWKDTFAHLITGYDLHSEALKVAVANIYHHEAAIFERKGMYNEALKMARLARSVLPGSLPAGMLHILQTQVTLSEKLGNFNDMQELVEKFEVEEIYSVGWVWKKRMQARLDQHSCIDQYNSAFAHFKELQAARAGNSLLDYDLSLASDDLAGILMMRGNYQEAVAECRKGLAQRISHFGAGHPITLVSKHHLASILFKDGKFVEALKYINLAIAGREKTLGAQHPETAHSKAVKGRILVSLAVTLADFDDAENLISTSMGHLRAVIGTSHPLVLECRAQIAHINLLRGNYDQAESQHLAVLMARQSSPWLNAHSHPDTLCSRHALAEIQRLRSGHTPISDDTLSILSARIATLGAMHPDTLTSQLLRAIVLSCLGEHVEAQSLISSTLASRCEILSPNHPDILSAMSWKGEIIRAALLLESDIPAQMRENSLVEIYRLHKSAYAALGLIFGHEHQRTLTVATNWVLVKADGCSVGIGVGRGGVLGSRRIDIEEGFAKIYSAYRRSVGDRHPETLKAVGRLGNACVEWGEGTMFWRRSCGGLAMRYGDDAFLTAWAFGGFEKFIARIEREDGELVNKEG